MNFWKFFPVFINITSFDLKPDVLYPIFWAKLKFDKYESDGYIIDNNGTFAPFLEDLYTNPGCIFLKY
jgi:hypothetical protein